METLSALLSFCAGNSPVVGESPAQGQWRGACNESSNTWCELTSWALLVELLSDEYHSTPSLISEHCFRYWLNDVRQQTITRAIADQVLYISIVSLCRDHLSIMRPMILYTVCGVMTYVSSMMAYDDQFFSGICIRDAFSSNRKLRTIYPRITFTLSSIIYATIITCSALWYM